MEALAAISLAGNLAQFLEHALKAVSKTHSKLDENLDLEEIAQDFKYGFAEKLGKLQVEIDRREAKDATLKEAITILIERKHKRRRLKKELGTIEEKIELEGKLQAIAKDATDSLNMIDLDSKGSDDIISSLELPLSGSRAAEYDVLQGLMTRGLNVAGEILGILNGLKVSDTPNTGIYLKIKIISKTLWKQAELQELHDRLDTLRAQISTHLLALLLEQQRSMHQDLRMASSQNGKNYAELNAKLDIALRRAQYAANRKVPIEDDGATISYPETPDYQGEMQNFRLEGVVDHLRKMWTLEKHKGILDSLYYSQLEDREWAIHEAHGKTFEWIFEADSADDDVKKNSVNFIEWLKHGDGVFWVTGKAGSGKSTLMKFLTHHHETKRLVQKWAGNADLLLAQHYFWSPGTAMQKSQQGLLRGLLRQVFKQRTSLIGEVIPDRWNSPYINMFDPWRRSELVKALEKLGTMAQAEWRICFFIDGLDEYSGDQFELANDILRMGRSPNIKICASSRPWNEFTDAFEHSEWKLYLHDLTRDDIHMFVKDNLRDSDKFKRLQQSDGVAAEKLSLEITDRAQGVFLWVFLVVRSLLHGLMNEDDIQDLRKRLRALPTDLKETFSQMLNNIDEFYRKRTARLFLTLAHAATSFPVLAFHFMDFGDKALSKEPLPFLRYWPDVDKNAELLQAMDRKKRQLIGQCKDLIFITPVPNAPDLFNERVGFLHRTVVDFIQTRDIRAQLEDAAEDFSPDKVLLDANVGQLRSLIHQHRLSYIRPRLGQWVLGALYYARRVEFMARIPAVDALDDLEVIIMSVFARWGFGHAMTTLLPGGPRRTTSVTSISSFMDLVCRYDLALYVSCKLPDVDIERLDTLAPNWRARVDIKRSSGFELCDLVEGDYDTEWRLWKKAQSSLSSEDMPAGMVAQAAIPCEFASPPRSPKLWVEFGLTSEDGAKGRRRRFSAKWKGLLRGG
ncbi:hypothetical protein GCG54_00004384 [Colletotrichum gloeosporioides]|uniref:NACHT domain-containing protein n=1 Tax=Colletotrichum gloeosporioides TaxID=474922 RepID=A0A8H4FKW5_COLGL|nr:uncharacterized protein GCG54_00004384 [Colletotrichum gloeosporioides]KAF3806058.1 hypothetical protein GCG54_00004384 [Colletotrichum gloeosporioides]